MPTRAAAATATATLAVGAAPERPRFSLVVCTIGRPDYLQALMVSLAAQTFRDFEVILIDQSKGDEIKSLIQAFSPRYPLLYLESAKGLSLGRNIGLRHVQGEVVAFPDDDCSYPPDTLERVDRLFRSHPQISGITGRSVSSTGEASGPRAPSTARPVEDSNIWYCGISYTIFLLRAVVERVGAFDERLGVGAGTRFGSGEETDYLLRAMHHGFQLRYFPELSIQHPIFGLGDLPARLLKDYRYAVGLGFVVRKHQLGLLYLMPHLIKPALGIVYSLLRLNVPLARVCWSRLRGRWEGYFAA